MVNLKTNMYARRFQTITNKQGTRYEALMGNDGNSVAHIWLSSRNSRIHGWHRRRRLHSASANLVIRPSSSSSHRNQSDNNHLHLLSFSYQLFKAKANILQDWLNLGNRNRSRSLSRRILDFNYRGTVIGLNLRSLPACHLSAHDFQVKLFELKALRHQKDQA